MPCFIAQLMTILVLIGMVGLLDKLRDFPWEDILKSVLLLLLVNFVGKFRLELNLL